jgi:propanol-preferring alcohol dehydrogenase
MKAWQLDGVYNLQKETKPLRLNDIPMPEPKEGELLIRIGCCGVCHTELDEIEGRTPPPTYPVVPGHQVVGRVEATGTGVTAFKTGDRVGVAWIYRACGNCPYCLSGNENLCPDFRATGRDEHGGYAEYMVVDERYAYRIPGYLTDAEAAPLLCAGAIGYRSLKLSNLKNGNVLGLAGFGASNHLVLKLAKSMFPDSQIWVFARSKQEQEFALELGAVWAGDYTTMPPLFADAVIETTPAWRPVLKSLSCLKPGGRLVINAIRKENGDQHELATLNYAHHLWMEKEIKSVANITSADVRQFFVQAERAQIKPFIQEYPMREANQALWELKNLPVKGAKVLLNTD